MNKVKNEKLQQMILQFKQLGYGIVETKNKAPVVNNWEFLSSDKSLWAGNLSTTNEAGFVIPKDIVVIDVDPRNFNFNIDSLQELSKAIGFDLLNETSFNVKTASGGFHLYFKKNPLIKLPNEIDRFRGVEFKQKGQQVIIPYSILPDRRQYLLHVKQKNLDKLTELPNSFINFLKKILKMIE